MVLAIPIIEKDVKSFVSTKFARSNCFAIVNKEDNRFDLIINKFSNEQTGVGKKLFAWLTDEYKVDTLLAYELGIKVQQLAHQNNMQLIIMNDDQVKLEKLLAYLNVTY